MTVKEKIIRKSIKVIENEISNIDEIINATPLLDIIKLRKKAIEIARDKNPNLEKLQQLANQEKKLFRVAELQQNMSEYISKKVKLQMELSGYLDELYWIERKKR